MRPCCRRTWILCWLDQAAHTLHLDVHWLCDRHDRAITRDWA